MKKIWILFLPILFFSIRIGWEAKREYREGQFFEQKENWEEAIQHYERSAHAVLIGFNSKNLALEALWKIGTKLEKTEPTTALHAYEAIRASAFSTVSFYSPYKKWISPANERIAQLRANGKNGQTLAFQQMALSIREGPNLKYVALTDFSFLAWLGALLSLAYFGFTPKGELLRKKAGLWSLGFIAFFGLWIWSLVHV